MPLTIRRGITCACFLISVLLYQSAASAEALYPFDGSYSPIDQNWKDYTSGSGNGYVVQDQGVDVWEASGVSGRSQWMRSMLVPEIEAANDFGYEWRTRMKVVSGGNITNYFADGEYRYLPTVYKAANGDLMMQLEGAGTYTLATGVQASDYNNYRLRYTPSSGTAEVFFNGVSVASWAGAATNQSMLVFGNGSTFGDGVARYQYFDFEILGGLDSPLVNVPVFPALSSGPNESPYYRIPSLLETPGDGLFAFAEGRPNGGDPGQTGLINVTVKRSMDDGLSWSQAEILSDVIPVSGEHDYSDPRPLYDAVNDRLWVTYAQWPDLCAQNGDCIKPDQSNAFIAHYFDSAIDSWSAPQAIGSVRERAWDVLGLDGRATWTKSLSGAELQAVSNDGWTLSFTVRVVEGGYHTFYFANGSQRFLPILSLNSENDLVMSLEGYPGGEILIESDTGNVNYHTVSMVYDSQADQASVLVDNQIVATGWSGSSTTQSGIIWGNGSTVTDGRVLVKDVEFVSSGNTMAKFDATVTGADPLGQGWAASHTGNGRGALGVKSVNPGPGHGIQLEYQQGSQSAKNGRLLLPSIVLDAYGFLNVRSIYSDDAGASWSIGGEPKLDQGWNASNQLDKPEPSEADIVELTSGLLLMSARNDGDHTVNGVYYGPRIQFTSNDGGETWVWTGSAVFSDINQVDTAIVKYTPDPNYPANRSLVFSAPIGDPVGSRNRNDLGLWTSDTAGQSWVGPAQITDGAAWYSDTIELSDGDLGILIESGGYNIDFLKIPVDLLP